MPERTPDGKEWIEDDQGAVDALGLTPAQAESLLEEVAQHLDERVADLQRSGVSASEARRLALGEVFEDERVVGEESIGAATGGTTAARATGLRATDASARRTGGAEPHTLGAPVSPGRGSPVGRAPGRGSGTGPPLTGLVRDVRYAVRTLWHQRGYAAAAALALAVGISGTTVVFGAVDAVLLGRCRSRTPIDCSCRSASTPPGASPKPPSPSRTYEEWRNTGLFRRSRRLAARRLGSDGRRRSRTRAHGDRQRTVLPIDRRHAGSRPHAAPRRSCARRAASHRDQPRPLAAALRRRGRHHRPARHARRRGLRDRRRAPRAPGGPEEWRCSCR